MLDLIAARLELLGQQIPLVKASGAPYQHLKEVQEAQAGLVTRIQQIQARLGYGGTSDSERQSRQEELSQASRLLDFSEGFVPR